ncbi:MAG: M20/M25/M40 family metallo-hydrolase, partial [Actinomycetes bacterium]
MTDHRDADDPAATARILPGPSDPSDTRAALHVQEEAVRIASELIAIDTSNYGDGSGPGERKAAEYVAALLDEVGVETELVEAAPGRSSLVARLAGRDPGRPGLLWHGHLDVVPARREDWQVDPFAGEIRDGYLWGRGAVDMKGADAMMLALIRSWAQAGHQPPRDVVVAFLADEESGSVHGSHWIVDHRPDLVEGCSEAISEVGGFSVTVPGRTGAPERLYLVETAEKGIAWLRLVAEGRAGHGSMVHEDNAVTRLAEAVTRVGTHRWPVRLTPTVRRLLDELAEVTGVPYDPADPIA